VPTLLTIARQIAAPSVLAAPVTRQTSIRALETGEGKLVYGAGMHPLHISGLPPQLAASC
jgi:hypothetical protein